MEEIIFEDEPQEEKLPRRTPAAHCLPNGTRLVMRASHMCVLADTFKAEDCLVFYPSKQEEFGVLLWIVANGIEECSKPRNDGPPLRFRDYAEWSSIVLKWIDENFRPSEFYMIEEIAKKLWLHNMETRVVLSEKKST